MTESGVGDGLDLKLRSIASLPLPDLTRWRRVHLVGVGGAGMSGVARLLLSRQIAVSGSDLKDSRRLEGLRAMGAEVFVGHRREQVGSPDALVLSAAIPPDNPEVREAHRRSIPVLSRAQVLAALMRGRRGVAVAGTHGKTTTTSMISVMLQSAGLAPSYVIGGDLNEIGSGAWHGAGDVFVAEADESDGSFLLYEPEVAVITNVEQDHVDFYEEPGAIDRAFRAFASRARMVVACADDPGAIRAAAGSGHVLTYGLAARSDLRLTPAESGGAGVRGTVSFRGRRVEVEVSIPGRHNLSNACAALSVAVALEVPLDRAAMGLRSFGGVRRRFEYRGAARGARFVDDYAHHPTEVATTLRAAADWDSSRIVAVFQPHRYTRTGAMWRAMGESLAGADVVVVTDVYGAGERPIPGVTGKLLVDALAEAEPGKRIVYLPRRSDIAPFLASEVREGDIVLTLGAGDITMVGEETLERIRDPAEAPDDRAAAPWGER